VHPEECAADRVLVAAPKVDFNAFMLHDEREELFSSLSTLPMPNKVRNQKETMSK
jgi:hypothetical protein